MRFEFTTSGKFDNTLKWLDDVKDKVPTKTMQAIGKEGVSKLAAATPKGETGETAAGWGYTVEKTSNGAELSFHNRQLFHRFHLLAFQPLTLKLPLFR